MIKRIPTKTIGTVIIAQLLNPTNKTKPKPKSIKRIAPIKGYSKAIKVTKTRAMEGVKWIIRGRITSKPLNSLKTSSANKDKNIIKEMLNILDK